MWVQTHTRLWLEEGHQSPSWPHTHKHYPQPRVSVGLLLLGRQEEPTPQLSQPPTVTGWGVCPCSSLMKSWLACTVKIQCTLTLRALSYVAVFLLSPLQHGS